jgi:hypothetical protein
MKRLIWAVLLFGCDDGASDPADLGAPDAQPDARIRMIRDAALPDAAPEDAHLPDMTVDMAIDMAPDMPLNRGPCMVEADDEDADRDGLTNAEERAAGSNPCDHDSDGDGFLDIAEIQFGGAVWDPQVGVDDYIAVPADPGWVAIDVPFQLTLNRADIFFLLDATGSMSGTIQALANGFDHLVTSLSPALPDSTYGVAIYRDYAYGQMGTPGVDKPFELIQQLRPEVDLVQQSLANMETSGGGDGLASTMEALYQTLTGIGYDQACDGGYQQLTDVPPLESSAGDPFGGTAPPVLDERRPGKLGGAGFRRGALKLVVYAADTLLRDPDNGFETPGGCPDDAGMAAVVAAAGAIDAKLVGVAVNDRPLPQMQALAQATGSVTDDGMPMIINGGVVGGLIDVVASFLGAAEFDRIHAEVVRDDLGIGQGIAPPAIGPISNAELVAPISFRLEIDTIGKRTDSWQISVLDVQMVADGGLELANRRFLIEVPPR